MRSAVPLLLLLAVGLAGCLAPAAPVAPQGGALPGLPRPAVVAPRFAPPVALEALRGATEPNIRADHEDRVFVTTTAAHLYRSLDGGATWQAMGDPTCRFALPGVDCLPGMSGVRSPLTGGGDGALAVDEQEALHWAGLFGANNTTVPYQRSVDHGATWSAPFDLARGNGTDREWIASGPNGSVYALWRDDGAPGKGVDPLGLASTGGQPQPRIMFRASRDRGATWGPIQPILEQEPIDGPLAVDLQRDFVYAAVSPLDGGALQFLRSLDGGRTWSVTPIASRNGTNPVDQQAGAITTFIFPVTAVDDAGTVYVAWAEDASQQSVPGAAKAAEVPHVYLAVSKDHGASFGKPVMLSPPDKPAVLPAIAAGAPGRVALGWYEAAVDAPTDALPNEWFVTLAESTTADAANATWRSAHTTSEPIHLGSICTQGTGCLAGDRSRGDFFEVALRPNGQPILAYVTDQAAQDAAGSGTRAAVLVSRVTEGTSLR